MTQQDTPQQTPATRSSFAIVFGLVALLVGIGIGWFVAGSGSDAAAAPGGEPKVLASSPEVAGRYLVRIAGCNDCHTPGFMQRGEEVPESEWLTGEQLGFRGPWGTTYASNLRLYVQDLNEDAFVNLVRQRKTNPPMPWDSLHAMNEQDLRAIYKYIKSMGPAGERAPAYVPPDREPSTPHFLFFPQMPGQQPQQQQQQ